MIRGFSPLSVKHKVIYIRTSVGPTSQLADEWLNWQLVCHHSLDSASPKPTPWHNPKHLNILLYQICPTTREDSIGLYAIHTIKKNKNFFTGLHVLIYNFRKRFQLYMMPGWIRGPTNFIKNPYWTWRLTSQQNTCPLRPEDQRGNIKIKDQNMHSTKSNLRFNTYTYTHPKPRVLNDSIRTCSIKERAKYHKKNPEIT